MLEKALSLQPDNVNALQLITSFYLSKKDTDKAIERVQRQIQAVPQNPVFYGMLGSLYEMKKDIPLAETNMKRPSN